MNSYCVNVDTGAVRSIDSRKESVFDFVKLIKASDGAVLGYTVKHQLNYYSARYKKWVTVEAGDVSDGATNAPDIDSFCWLFHDAVCNSGKFSDGSTCDNWQASTILSDILRDEGKWIRAITWFAATYALGGGKARDNGMF